MSALQILVVEDNDGDALILEGLLADDVVAGQVELTRASSMSELEAHVLGPGPQPDCILLDLGLPDATGIEAVEAATQLAPHVPIVVFTVDTSSAQPALRAGAQDYLVKGQTLTTDAVRRAVRHSIGRAEQMRALLASQRELEAFAHQLAHDLKTPLATLTNAVELLGSGAVDDDDLRDIILRASARMRDMVDRLLEYAQSAGRDGSLQRVDLDSALDWALATLGPRLDDVDLHVDRPLPTVRAHPTGMRHIFLNLLDNAVKFRAEGRRPRIVVTGTVGEAGDAVVTVADNGVGIDATERVHVLDLGVRGDHQVPGTGLGLAAVQRTMELAGGRVDIGAGPGEVGTSVRLRFPPPG